MNKITTTIIIAGALAFTGCKKWLDVKPEGLTTKDEMFKTQKGFRDALTGAYIDMKSGDAYGGAFTWGTVEFLAKNWDIVNTANLEFTGLVNANYVDAAPRAALDRAYAKEYKIIADVNSILENIDAQKNIFQDDNYALIKGEALAIRAYAHFDILRLFGPIPDKTSADPILPYVTEVSKDIVPLSTYDDFTKQVVADLDQAELLLKDVDPITKYSLLQLNPSKYRPEVPAVITDDYYNYRQVRMNYYAVLALKARVYNWLVPKGDANRQNAIKYAQMVIDGKDRTGTPTFRLGELTDQQKGDYSFTSEHITSVNYYNLGLAVESLFGETGQLTRQDFNVQDGYYYLNNMFPVAERAADARWVGMWPYKTTTGLTNYVKIKKYIQKPLDQEPNNQIPLLRLSEMYLILTECATNKADAETPYRIYCGKKGIPFTSGFNAAGWEADRKNKMIREYVREFFAEGQTFFTYKRYNVTALPAAWVSSYTGTTARYLVTKPDREINYRNK